MALSAKEIEEKVAAFEEEQQDENGYYREGVYYQLHWGESVEVKGLPTLEYVDSFGGEGMGDDYWVVFKVGNQYFRKDGWYASYDGGELDGDLYEVEPVEVTRTEYQRKK